MFRKGLCEGLESLVPSRWEHGEGIQGGPLGDTGIPRGQGLGKHARSHHFSQSGSRLGPQSVTQSGAHVKQGRSPYLGLDGESEPR